MKTNANCHRFRALPVCIRAVSLTVSLFALTQHAPLASGATPDYEVISLDFIPADINDSGTVVGKNLVWTRNEGARVVDSRVTQSGLTAIDNDNRISGTLLNQILPNGIGELRAFLSLNSSTTVIGGLGTSPYGTSPSFGRATANGMVVGNAMLSNGQFHAFSWKDGSITDLGSSTSFGSEALAVNVSGTIVGWEQGLGTPYPVYWQNGVMTRIATDFDISPGAIATAINSQGQIVVMVYPQGTSSDDPRRGFLWSGGITTDLGDLQAHPYQFGPALDINDGSQVIGVARNGQPFLWENGERRYLKDLVDPTLNLNFLTVSAINNEGQIVGMLSSGAGFLASPIHWRWQRAPGADEFSDASGLWSDQTRWNKQSVPDQLRRVEFNQLNSGPAGYTVSIPDTADARTVKIETGTDRVRLTGGKLHIHDPSVSLTVKKSNAVIAAHVTTEGDTVVVDGGHLWVPGPDVGPAMVVGSVTGADNPSLHVKGKLNISRASLLSTDSAYIDGIETPGSVVLNGAGSLWDVSLNASGEGLIVGKTNKGRLDIVAGAKVDAGSLFVGFDAGASGEIFVDGLAQLAIQNFAWLGVRGAGTLNVVAASHVSLPVLGAISVFPFIVGEAETGTGTIHVNRSSMSVGGYGILLGDRGTGRLEVSNGGTVSSSLMLGRHGGSGTLLASGEGTKISAPGLFFGAGGQGAAVITDRAIVTAQSVDIGNANNPQEGTGSVEIRNHASLRSISVRVAPGSDLIIDNSDIQAEGGGLSVENLGTIKLINGQITADVLAVGEGGVISGTGNIDVPEGGLFNWGTIAPGLSPGTLTINGDLRFGESGELIIEIGGYDFGQRDHLIINGNATLGGKIVFRFVNGFAPRKNDRFDFAEFHGSSVGQFSQYLFENLAEGFEFEVSQNQGVFEFQANNDGISTVPVPPAVILFGSCLTSIWSRARRSNWVGCRKGACDVKTRADNFTWRVRYPKS